MRRCVLVILLAACGTTKPPAAAPMAPAVAPAAEPGIAPRPFTAEQIRDSMPVGHEFLFRIETAGQPTIISHWVVVGADQGSVTIESKTYDDTSKALLADEGRENTTWIELMKHATFPADATTVSEGTVEVPAGRFDTITYIVRDTADEVRTLHFAKRLPGPPVLMIVERAGEVVMRMTLIDRG